MNALKRRDLWLGVQASVRQGQTRRSERKERVPRCHGNETLFVVILFTYAFFSCAVCSAETLLAEATRARVNRSLSGRSRRSVHRVVCLHLLHISCTVLKNNSCHPTSCGRSPRSLAGRLAELLWVDACPLLNVAAHVDQVGLSGRVVATQDPSVLCDVTKEFERHNYF